VALLSKKNDTAPTRDSRRARPALAATCVYPDAWPGAAPLPISTLLSVSVAVPVVPLRPLTRRSFTGRALLGEGVLSSASSVTAAAAPVSRTVRSAPGGAVNGAAAASWPLTCTVTGPAGTRMYGPMFGDVRP